MVNVYAVLVVITTDTNCLALQERHSLTLSTRQLSLFHTSKLPHLVPPLPFSTFPLMLIFFLHELPSRAVTLTVTRQAIVLFYLFLSNKGLNNTSSTPSHDLCGPLAVLMIPGFICKHFGNAATKLTDNTHLRRQKLGELRDLVYIQHAILTHYSSLHFGFMGWLCVNCLFNVDIFLHSF